jgi:hypothetical protein
MSLNISILMDESDVAEFTAFCDGVGRKTSRDELLPIMLEHLAPLAESERAFLADHTESGALAQSLVARSGPGDRPGTMSVFSAPTATVEDLQETWGKHGRGQQRKWAAGLKLKGGRRRVFYGPIVHQGHRIIVRGPGGTLVQSKTHPMTDPVPFAQQAVDAMGDEQADALAEAILDHILGK